MLIEMNELEIAQVLVDWLNERRVVRQGVACNVDFQKRDDGRFYAVLIPGRPAETIDQAPREVNEVPGETAGGPAYPDEEYNQ